MTKNNITRKLISFESNGKDFSNLAKELSNGWQIVETAQHPSKKNVFFCKLKKDIDQENASFQELSVKDVLNLIQDSRTKNYNKSTKPIYKEKILEDV